MSTFLKTIVNNGQNYKIFSQNMVQYLHNLLVFDYQIPELSPSYSHYYLQTKELNLDLPT